MTLEEYKLEAERLIREMLKVEDDAEVDCLIRLLQNDMERSYYSSVKLSACLGANQVSPNSYAYGIFMMWEGTAKSTVEHYNLA